MPHPYERSLEDVVETVRNAPDGVVVLAGAGCSKTAGIPLAEELCKIIEDRFPQAHARAKRNKTLGYQGLMAQLSLGERRDLLAEFIDGAKLNWAHIALAQLIEGGYVTRVLTPNFDPLIVQACALLNIFPAIYDFAASQTFKRGFVPTPAVYYLHGQPTGFRLLNTEAECLEHARHLEPVFDEAGDGRPWIVLGYSGENDPVFEHLLAKREFDRRLYWIGYGKEDPPPHLERTILREGRYAHYVRDYGADRFLASLAEQMDCFPPDLVQRPFTHLSRTFERIGTYEHEGLDGSVTDLLGEARELVGQAIEQIEQAERTPEKDRKARLTEAIGLLIGGNPEEAVELLQEEERTDEEAELLAWAWVEWGNDLQARAEKTEDMGESDRLLAAAEEKYAAALSVKPGKYEALLDWGDALQVRAEKMEDVRESDRLLATAEEKYAAALAVKPDDHAALYYWGVALQLRAEKTEDVGESDRLLAAAAEKYAAALAVKPDDHEALYSWGDALQARAEKTEDVGESDRLLAAAEEKYAAALAVTPDDHEGLTNSGAALVARARLTEGEERRRLLGEAESLFQEALALAPAETYDLACLRVLQGRIPEARKLLLRAKEAGTLPDRRHLEEDPDLEAVRGEDPDLEAVRGEEWFGELLAG